jgi:hypothetical protein
MKQIEWKIAVRDNNTIAILEKAVGLPQDQVESHLTIIGILEHIKQKHEAKLKCLFEKTVRGDRKDDSDL